MNNRLELVDFLKGYSIFTIVVMHFVQHYTEGFISKVLSFGGAGVHVFFLCSGFGLYLSHLRQPLSYTRFLKRRFLKVYIPYVIVILIGSLVPFFYTETDKWYVVAGRLFLYRGCVKEWELAMGQEMWFVCTIVQFYLCWPLIVSLFKCKGGLLMSFSVSLIWTTVVLMIGKSGMRIWNSFFLQYIWEFVLGMWLAKKYAESDKAISLPSWWKISIVAVVCMAITGYMGFKGGILTSYNDATSLIAYLSCALLVYKTRIINTFFVITSKFSYELFLVHILVFVCVIKAFEYYELRIAIILIASLAFAYIIAYFYSCVLKKLNLK